MMIFEILSFFLPRLWEILRLQAQDDPASNAYGRGSEARRQASLNLG